MALASFLAQLVSVLISYKFWYFLMYNYDHQDNLKEIDDRISLGSNDRPSKTNFETNILNNANINIIE